MSKRDGISKDENFCFFRRNFGEISCFGGRRNERGGRNVDGRNIRKFRQKSEKFQINFSKRRNFGDFLKKLPPVGKFQRKIVLFRFISAIFRPKKQKFSYQSSPRTGYKIWSWFAGKACVFQPGSKIVDLGFVKFKSNGTTAKRTLKQIQKTQGAKEKQFFWFSLGVLHGFLGNQTRMNFPGNRMGDGFSMESNGGCKKKIICLD